jgi:hypothetical protein
MMKMKTRMRTRWRICDPLSSDYYYYYYIMGIL